jgi:hypothetical protein
MKLIAFVYADMVGYGRVIARDAPGSLSQVPIDPPSAKWVAE